MGKIREYGDTTLVRMLFTESVRIDITQEVPIIATKSTTQSTFWKLMTIGIEGLLIMITDVTADQV